MSELYETETPENYMMHQPLSGEDTHARRVTFPGNPLLSGGEIGRIVKQSRAFNGPDQVWTFETTPSTSQGDVWVMYDGEDKPGDEEYLDAVRIARIFSRLARSNSDHQDK